MRYLYFTFGGLAFAALAVTFIGSRLPTRHQVTRERGQSATIEAFLADADAALARPR